MGPLYSVTCNPDLFEFYKAFFPKVREYCTPDPSLNMPIHPSFNMIHDTSDQLKEGPPTLHPTGFHKSAHNEQLYLHK